MAAASTWKEGTEIRGTRAESFGARAEVVEEARGSYRLPIERQDELCILFTGLEGLRSSSYWMEAEVLAGVRSREEAVHLHDLEAHCDRVSVWIRRGAGEDARGIYNAVNRARTALLLLVEGFTALGPEGPELRDPNPLAVRVLRAEYGDPPTGLRRDFFGDAARLAEMTPTVQAKAEERRELELEGLRRGYFTAWAYEAALATGLAPATEPGGPQLLALERAAERLAAAPLDTRAVLRSALDLHLPRLGDEKKKAWAARQIVERSARACFVAAVKVESDRLLASASTAYREAWGRA